MIMTLFCKNSNQMSRVYIRDVFASDQVDLFVHSSTQVHSAVVNYDSIHAYVLQFCCVEVWAL